MENLKPLSHLLFSITFPRKQRNKIEQKTIGKKTKKGRFSSTSTFFGFGFIILEQREGELPKHLFVSAPVIKSIVMCSHFTLILEVAASNQLASCAQI